MTKLFAAHETASGLHFRVSLKGSCPFPYTLKQGYQGHYNPRFNLWVFPADQQPRVRAFLEARGWVDTKEHQQEKRDRMQTQRIISNIH